MRQWVWNRSSPQASARRKRPTAKSQIRLTIAAPAAVMDSVMGRWLSS
jgi:hypothetical protein